MTESLLIQAVFAFGLLSTGPLVSVKANFDFTVRFYEYWNPTGLCAECGTNGVPVCCDDPLLTESCQNTGVFRCDTGFRYILRPFNAPLENAPDTGFPFFTKSHTNLNHETFAGGPFKFLNLPNPSIISNTSSWTGRIQFLVDAVDKYNTANSHLMRNETEGIIDRFLINLDQLQLGADLTEETTYTGIHNISQLSMSFRVKCSENYYSSNCTTFCEAVEGVYNCNSNGNIVCIDENRTPHDNCTEEFNKSGTNVSILIGGVVGGLVGLLLISILLVLIVLCVILRLQLQHKRESYAIASNTVDYVEQLSEDTPNKKESFENSTASNPIYWVTEPTTATTTTTFNNTIYDEPQLELTQSVKKNNTSAAATYETVDCLQENKTNHTAQVEVLDNPNYSEIMESTTTTTGPGKQETEKDMLVFDDPEYGTASYEEKEPSPSTVFDCAEYECPTVTVATNDTANIQQADQQPSATIFDCVEYESPTVPASSGYSVLKHSKANIDRSTSTSQGTVTIDTTTAGEGYSKLHHNTNTEANCHTQNTQHPSPQSIYDVATSNGTEQSHETCKEDALIYHYATVDSPAHHHPTISDSANNDNTPGYVNTTPGKMTPEALDHYDLGQ